MILQAAHDTHPRVRLEAIVAASWLDHADGARIALEALRYPFAKWPSDADRASSDIGRRCPGRQNP